MIVDTENDSGEFCDSNADRSSWHCIVSGTMLLLERQCPVVRGESLGPGDRCRA